MTTVLLRFQRIPHLISIASVRIAGRHQCCRSHQTLCSAVKLVSWPVFSSKQALFTSTWKQVGALSLLRQLSTMPPVNSTPLAKVDAAVKQYDVVIFSKSTCPFCKRVKELFKSLNVEYHAIELDRLEDGPALQDALEQKTGQRTVPNVFIRGNHIGGCDKTLALHQEGKLLPMVQDTSHPYDYDLLIIGGGSGGLSAGKEAARYGKRVCVCDFVAPSPPGTTWGLGGTCVNVGCIPKKLMHQTALLGEALHDAANFGWEVPPSVHHNWKHMVEGVQAHIGSLNWGYKVALREASVTYLNEYAEFIDAHTLKTTNKKGVSKTVTADKVLIAVGGRPSYPEIEGAREYGITSDDLFSLSYAPGKTLLVGASYIALECAGFLAGMGVDVTVMVRSILLRGFDQQMANMIGDYMETVNKIKFIKECVPTKVEKVGEGTPGKLKVTATMKNGEVIADEYNTVMFAIGRTACTDKLALDKIGVKVNKKNSKVIVNEKEQSHVPNIFAIGDVIDGRLELTPVAIQAGKLLARRLYGGSSTLTDYTNVPTTVFTPLEYGCVGLSEEDALDQYGEDNIEVYHSNFLPLEWTVPKRGENHCYAKIICVKSDKERVVGLHVLGPNSAEITQGFAIGLKMGATKDDFDSLIGIHPSNAEIFTTLRVTKSSGISAAQKGC